MRFPLLALALPCLMTIATATDAPMTSKAVLPTDLKAKIDAAVNEVLTKTSVPSASIAVIKAGQIVYVSAYGDACLEPKKAAAPEMRYSIGSISKQFTAAAIILLAQDGKLSLDDKVSKYLPNLTRANEISIRQILSHTSGYQDYWPQDYLMPPMKIPTTAEKIMDIWAKKPLDFDPGTKYQYSNTGFVIAGAIVEKISGTALLSFLQNRIFGPLGMKSVWDSDQKILPESDAVGHHRYALGPVRRAQKEGTGWMFAAGNLAMTAEDLAKWDLSVIDQTLLKAGSYHEMETEGRLNNGAGTLYGLGIGVSIENGHRVLGHGGEVMGFTAYNGIYPDDRMAIVVLTNQDAVGAYGTIAKRISSALLESKDEVSESRLALTKKIFIALQKGVIDRALFTGNCNSYFDQTALLDISRSIGSLGEPLTFVQSRQYLRGGITVRTFLVTYPNLKLRITTNELSDGKFEQYLIAPTE